MNESELTKITSQLIRVLGPAKLNVIARRTGFIVRERKITGQSMAVSLICALAVLDANTLADFHRAFVELSGTDIAYKPFHDQLSKDAFPEMMRRVVCEMMGAIFDGGVASRA